MKSYDAPVEEVQASDKTLEPDELDDTEAEEL